MIDFHHVSKNYGIHPGVTDLTFSVSTGITGLLGQNGAGKTTSLNLMTGYFPPSAGEVIVSGVSITSQPRTCKRHIGYLPEIPPLYDEMTVEEYLGFAASLREVVKADIPAHLQEIVSLCGLTERTQSLCGSLSKGYRQRVGIAQALCGSPDILILDEPTAGLDPKQVVEIRRLIRELGKKHTVIFSSHNLAEVQQLCDRVLILHRGRLVREVDLHADSSSDLKIRLSAVIRESDLLPALRSLPCVKKIYRLSAHSEEITSVEITCTENEDDELPQVRISRLLQAMGVPLTEMTPLRDTLEETFLQLTQES